MCLERATALLLAKALHTPCHELSVHHDFRHLVVLWAGFYLTHRLISMIAFIVYPSVNSSPEIVATIALATEDTNVSAASMT